MSNLLPIIKKALYYLLLAVAWIILSIPVGGVALAAKEKLGWNIFTNTGYHALEKCLAQEVSKAMKEKKR